MAIKVTTVNSVIYVYKVSPSAQLGPVHPSKHSHVKGPVHKPPFTQGGEQYAAQMA